MHTNKYDVQYETGSTTVARTLVYVGIAFSLFMTAEGIAHVSGRGDTALTTPVAVAAVEQQQQQPRITPAAIDVGTGASYLPAIVRVQSNEELWNQPEMAPTF